MSESHINPLGQPIGAPLADWQSPPWLEHRSLVGETVRLEPLCPHHGEALFEAFAEDRTNACWTYLPYGPFANASELAEWIRLNTRAADPQFYVVISAERALGVAAFLRIDPHSGSAEVGHIHFAPALQRTLAATEALYCMMRHVFDCGYRRFEWKCDALNAPSRRAATRLGFRFEGVWRQATHYKGRNRDTAWYAMIDRDWPSLEAAYRTWLAPDNFPENGQQRVALSALTADLAR